MPEDATPEIDTILASAQPGLQRLRLADGRRSVLKCRLDMPAGFFAAEVRGLALLAKAGGLRVPAVLGSSDSAVLLEDLGSGSPCKDYFQLAGRGLATQHNHRSAHFGLQHDGWCGDSQQSNRLDVDGHRFFAEQRLLPQVRQARAAGLLDAAASAAIETLCARLPALVPVQPAVLLHGDLWLGNLHCCEDGMPALVDAGAVHFGWAEAELAMLSLFGSPLQAFFDEYALHAPLAEDWRLRAPLYNLYHLLNHLNLFGRSYLRQVMDALRRYS